MQAFVEKVKGLDGDAQRHALVDNGYHMPHWPKPYGRAAGPVEQLVIEEEFRKAGIKKPQYGITAWNILTIIQHGNQDQMDRWVNGAMREGVDLVSAVLRARCGFRRRGRQDQGRQDRRRLARHRPEGVDLGRARVVATASPPCAPTPTCPSTTASR